MNLAILISLYLTTNLLIFAAYLILRALGIFTQASHRFISARTLLRLHILALFAVTAMPIAMMMLPKQPFFEPPAKIWSAPSMRQFSREFAENQFTTQPGYLLMTEGRDATPFSATNISLGGTLLISLALLAGSGLFLRDVRRLLNIRRQSHLARKFGRTQIFVSDHISIPFSYRTWKHANVIVPTTLLLRSGQYRIAIQHELQHHRQGDTITVYGIWLLRLLCLANPFMHLWARELSEIQEYACDESLVDLKKVDSHAYARCLFEVAQTAEGLKRVPVCATGLTLQTDGPLLKRRINMMLFQKKTKQNRLLAWTTAFGLTAIMTIGAFASTGLVQDRRITHEQAVRLAMKAKANTEFPIAMNERVLRQLNRYIGTPEGREFMRAALARMENERGPIEKAMKKYGVPRELLAMPIIESGFENLVQKPTSRSKAAGLWQFIPRTAQEFGLFVDPNESARTSKAADERLDVALETDAAMRLLVANKMRFRDWMLSVSAYNAGEERVQDGIDKTGSRDAWTLVGKGFEGDFDYLAKLHAAILIMNNPDSVL